MHIPPIQSNQSNPIQSSPAQCSPVQPDPVSPVQSSPIQPNALNSNPLVSCTSHLGLPYYIPSPPYASFKRFRMDISRLNFGPPQPTTGTQIHSVGCLAVKPRGTGLVWCECLCRAHIPTQGFLPAKRPPLGLLQVAGPPTFRSLAPASGRSHRRLAGRHVLDRSCLLQNSKAEY